MDSEQVRGAPIWSAALWALGEAVCCALKILQACLVSFGWPREPAFIVKSDYLLNREGREAPDPVSAAVGVSSMTLGIQLPPPRKKTHVHALLSHQEPCNASLRPNRFQQPSSGKSLPTFQMSDLKQIIRSSPHDL